MQTTSLSNQLSLDWLSWFRLPTFLLFGLFFGGSSLMQGWPVYCLYSASILIIGWSVYRLNLTFIIAKAPEISILIASLFIVQLLYLIPLPPAVWSHLPGRDFLIENFEALGFELPWLPISMAPEASLFSLYTFLPPLAAFLLAAHLSTKREFDMACWVIPIAAVISVILGIIQISDGSQALYFYEITNYGSPVGFFANVNHQATQLLIALPFAVRIMLTKKGLLLSFLRKPTATTLFGFILLLIICAGLLTNGSLAGYYLLFLCLGISVLLMTDTLRTIAWLAVPILFVVGLAAVDMLFLSSALEELSGSLASDGPTSRAEMFLNSVHAIQRFFPTGSGLGSFQAVYPVFENINTVTSKYAPHAHNDYLEFVMELGLPGMTLIIFFLWVWIRLANDLINANLPRSIPAFAGIVGSFMIMLHSFVDYPARTPAIGILGAFCLGLMVAGKSRTAAENEEHQHD